MSKNHGMSVQHTRNSNRPPRIIAEIIAFVVKKFTKNSDKNCIEKMHSSHLE